MLAGFLLGLFVGGTLGGLGVALAAAAAGELPRRERPTVWCPNCGHPIAPSEDPAHAAFGESDDRTR